MRFVVEGHRVEGLERDKGLPRHCESLERGIELMQQYTDKACKEHPRLRDILDVSKVPGKTRARKPKKVAFPITRFSCIMANPVAQIWVCTHGIHESPQLGRRKEGAKAPEGDKLPHEQGDFAVLKGDVPVLDEQGTPKVYKLRSDAEDEMQRLYRLTPEDERYSDNTDPERRTTTVFQNETISVHFDPDNNGSNLPFNLYNTRVFKPVLHPRGEFPLKFRSITGAVKEAIRLDKLNRGVS